MPDRIWAVWSHYENKIISIHKTKEEAKREQKDWDKLVAFRVGVTPRQYRRSHGEISEVSQMDYLKEHGMFIFNGRGKK